MKAEISDLEHEINQAVQGVNRDPCKTIDQLLRILTKQQALIRRLSAGRDLPAGICLQLTIPLI